MPGSRHGRDAIGQVLCYPASVARIIAALMTSALWSWAPVSGIAGPIIADAEPQGGSTAIVSPPVTPIPITAPTSPEPAPPGKTVPEGEPLPVEPPPRWTPVPDPVIQIQVKVPPERGNDARNE